MISTRDLSCLPGVDELKRLMQSLAMLDAIMQRDAAYRRHAFDCGCAQGKQIASMRTGGGDEWFCGFNKAGALLKGFDHESAMSPWRASPPMIWPRVCDNLPPAFKPFLSESAFAWQDTTFCIWRGYEDDVWQLGPIDFPPGDDPDGSAYLLQMLDGRPETYQSWSEGYYEREIDLSAVRQIYEHEPLAREIVRALNAKIDLADLRTDAETIGYPLQIRCGPSVSSQSSHT
jgi:hypothetical protein